LPPGAAWGQIEPARCESKRQRIPYFEKHSLVDALSSKCSEPLLSICTSIALSVFHSKISCSR